MLSERTGDAPLLARHAFIADISPPIGSRLSRFTARLSILSLKIALAFSRVPPFARYRI